MCPQLLEVFLLFRTKAKTLGRPTERWIQFLVTTDYQGCTAPFSELFTVLKQTVIDSLVLRIQLSYHLFILWFRSLFRWKTIAVDQDVHLEFVDSPL